MTEARSLPFFQVNQFRNNLFKILYEYLKQQSALLSHELTSNSEEDTLIRDGGGAIR